jgi:tetratricopeptide (TPR) repeat protein
MSRNLRPWRSTFMVLLTMMTAMTGVAGAATDPAPGTPPADLSHLRTENEYGIALALAGADAGAESVFVSLLSHSPDDARALNNLGNTNLLRGDIDVALAFYQQASEVDSSDPGIVLNAATAFMLSGDEDEAQAVAAEGVRRAGGLGKAALLLGLKAPESRGGEPKAGDRAYVRKDEVLALLRAAAASVPSDSSKARPAKGSSAQARTRKRASTWRSAGARGAEGTDAAVVVYWKQ